MGECSSDACTAADGPSEGVYVLEKSYVRKCVPVNQLCHRLQMGDSCLFTRCKSSVSCDINACCGKYD